MAKADSTCSVSHCDRPTEKREWCGMHYRRWQRTGDPLGTTRYVDTAEKIAALTTRAGDCLIWTGSLNPAGYARSRINGRHTMVHRYMWEQANGRPVPDGMYVDHICHNKACVNPEHLRPVTNKQNMENQNRAHRGNISGVRGVTWDIYAKRWVGRVTHNKVTITVGWFKDLAEADEAVRQKRLELFTHNDADRKATA